MAVRKEKRDLENEAARSRPIELITENGFSLVRSSDLAGAKTQAARVYAFMVQDPNGYELEITVEIDPAAVVEINRRSKGRISIESSFWISCAERHLAEYLWEQDDYPPGANLIVTQLTPADCGLAIRWGKDDSDQIRKFISLFFLLTLLALCFHRTESLQTAFNAPTTDVLDKGKVYFELDISAKPNGSRALDAFSAFVPRVVVGPGGRVEGGLNVLGNVQPGPDSTTLAPSIKWKVYDGKELQRQLKTETENGCRS